MKTSIKTTANRFGSMAGSACSHKLDYEQRIKAAALLDDILEDPEKFAFEIIALREGIEEIKAGARCDGRVWLKCKDDPTCREPGPALRDYCTQLLSPNEKDQPRRGDAPQS